jgi:hypothetical protein
MKTTIKVVKNEASTKVVSEIDPEYVKDLGTAYAVVCFDSDDIYELGYDIARERYAEKPEEFEIRTDRVPLLKQAISDYAQEECIRVTSFKFGEDVDGYTNVTVLPTRGEVLFRIYSMYGVLVERARQLKDKEKANS